MLLEAKSVPDNDLNHYKGLMWLPITLFLVNWQHRSVTIVTEKPQSSTLSGMQNVGQRGLILIKYRKPFKY